MTEDQEARRAALLRAQAGLDQELDASHALRLEEDLKSNPNLRRAWDSGRALRAVIAEHVEKQSASAHLRDRILALAGEAGRPVPWTNRAPGYAALAASLATAGFLAGFFVAQLRNAPPQAGDTQTLIAAYERAQLSGQAFDIASSDRHTVKPWLAARAPLGADVVDISEAGFQLAGGRLDIVDRSPVATLVYRRREHWIDLSEFPRSAGDASDVLTSESVDGYNVKRWSDAARSYVAISDIDDADLTNFVEAFRAKAESAPSEAAKPLKAEGSGGD
jgi:anti-sigma factor RsiW